ncbi:hypothetical protein AHAS_Ahas12G0145200 [Arachis hypogaea]
MRRKKILVDELEFDALRHIPSLNVTHKLLKELICSFDLYKSPLNTRYGKIKITSAKIKDAFSLNATGNNPFCNLFYSIKF